MKCHQVQRQSSQRFTRGEQISEEKTRTQNSCSQIAPKTACSFFQTCSFLFLFFFFLVRGKGNGEGKKGVVIFLRGSSLAVYIDLKQQNWESGCAEEEGYHCGIPGLVAMATWSLGLGPPLPRLGAAGGPGSGAQLLSWIPPAQWRPGLRGLLCPGGLIPPSNPFVRPATSTENPNRQNTAWTCTTLTIIEKHSPLWVWGWGGGSCVRGLTLGKSFNLPFLLNHKDLICAPFK